MLARFADVKKINITGARVRRTWKVVGGVVVIVSSGREEMEDDRSNYINTTGMETQLSTGALLGGRVDRLFAPRRATRASACYRYI
jgi:hypothetical protein